MKNYLLNKLAEIFVYFDIHYVKKARENYNLKYVLLKSKLGENVVLHGKGTIHSADKLKIGAHTRIGDNYFIMASGGVIIGENTQISRNVCIYSGNHDYKSDTHIPYDDKLIVKSVVIGNSVWIGMNVNITPGVTIGDGAIVGMGTTISKNIPSGAIVVNSKQRIIGERDVDKFKKLSEERRFFGKYFSDL